MPPPAGEGLSLLFEALAPCLGEVPGCSQHDLQKLRLQCTKPYLLGVHLGITGGPSHIAVFQQGVADYSLVAEHGLRQVRGAAEGCQESVWVQFSEKNDKRQRVFLDLALLAGETSGKAEVRHYAKGAAGSVLVMSKASMKGSKELQEALTLLREAYTFFSRDNNDHPDWMTVFGLCYVAALNQSGDANEARKVQDKIKDRMLNVK